MARDERELRIEPAGGRLASALMTMQILGVVAALAIGPHAAESWMRPLIAANLLLGLLIAKTLMENAYTVVRYWRDRA